uniref:Uncharacterized protein n=1 Tax=viral metagenome TaxID=1070528 RepID=A0A6M3K5V9_9ZZZZ
MKINKQIWAFVLGFIVVFGILVFPFIKQIDKVSAGIPLNTSYRVKAIVTSGGVYQTGLAASTLLSIMRNSDHYWLDFDDNTFKVSGHIAKTTALLEDSSNAAFGYYYYDWDMPTSEDTPEIYTFFVKCTGATKMYDSSDISYDRITFYFGQ